MVWLKVLAIFALQCVVFSFVYLLPLFLLEAYTNIILGDTLFTALLVIVAQAASLWFVLRALSRWFVFEDAGVLSKWYATLIGALFILGLVIVPSALSAIQALGSTIACYWTAVVFFDRTFGTSHGDALLARLGTFKRTLPAKLRIKRSVRKPLSVAPVEQPHIPIEAAPKPEPQPEISARTETPSEPTPPVSPSTLDPHDPDFWKNSEHPNG